MVKLSDDNLEHVLEDPGAVFESPAEVPNSSLSQEGKAKVLHGWRRWLLSDDWHAAHTDESHRRRDLDLIEQALREVEPSG